LADKELEHPFIDDAEVGYIHHNLKKPACERLGESLAKQPAVSERELVENLLSV